MTTMAKIFVGLNLILTVAVFGAAATLLGAQDDYRAALSKGREDWSKREADFRSELDKARTQEMSLSQQLSVAMAAKQAAEVEKEGYVTQLEQLRSQNVKITSANEGYAKELESLRAVLENKEQNAATMRAAMQEATENALNFQKRMEDALTENVRLQSQLADLNSQVEQMTADLETSRRDLRETKFWLEKAKEQGFAADTPTGEPGVVTSVKDNLVSLSVGSEDGVRVGDVYNVRRGSRYVGQVRITRVMKSMAVGEFDTQWATDAAPPQQGDAAAPSNIR